MSYEIRKSTTKMLECLGPAGEHIWRSRAAVQRRGAIGGGGAVHSTDTDRRIALFARSTTDAN